MCSRPEQLSIVVLPHLLRIRTCKNAAKFQDHSAGETKEAPNNDPFCINGQREKSSDDLLVLLQRSEPRRKSTCALLRVREFYFTMTAQQICPTWVTAGHVSARFPDSARRVLRAVRDTDRTVV